MQDIKPSVVLYSGFLLAFTGLAGMYSGFQPLAVFSAPLLWWAYVALSDSLIFSLKGESLIITRTDDFIWMAFCSCAVWLVFEAANIRLGLWKYSGLPYSRSYRWAWYFLYGSALLPALHQSAAFLLPGKARSPRPGKLSRPSGGASRAALAAGTAAILLSSAFPSLLFPLAAPGLLITAEWLALRTGLPSLWRSRLSGGRKGAAAIAAAGLFCGIVGEIWNLAGGPSRIYAFPFADGPDLLGMPLAGYAFFPLLALAAFPLHSLSLAARGEGRDLLGNENNLSLNTPSWLPPAAYPALFLLYYAAFRLLDAFSVEMFLGWL
ncbi:MAG TPA: hypothetical protein PKK31_05640 [Elusimicrobiales bacterium]|nr:hypothetical protein [Elusimicrobiales bacterium]